MRQKSSPMISTQQGRQLQAWKCETSTSWPGRSSPIVLPGETMRVISSQGGQGIQPGSSPIWNDGTMVVVDNARKLIGKMWISL